jgi:hypothetical protein
VETPDADNPEDGSPLTWAELLAAYRTGVRLEWSGQLLERLGPWLTAARHHLHAVPPYYDDEDVIHDLQAEVLRIASLWKPVCEDHWIPRRLVERAARKVVKSLLAEQLDQVVELGDEVEASQGAEPDLVLETPIGNASVADIRLIYRARVLREPIDDLADEAGLTPSRMRRRVKSALERARSRAAVRR